jgi:DNA-directed RNA polymerase subunit RPC12/RpoP
VDIEVSTSAVGTLISCNQCGHIESEGEFEEGCIILDNTEGFSIAYECKNCGSTDVDIQVYLKVNCN